MSRFTAETKTFFLFVLAAKIFILGVFLVVFNEDMLLWADSSLYLNLGRTVFHGDGFATTGIDGVVTVNTRFMPLYPMVLGLFSFIPHGLIIVSLLQAAAAAGITVFTYKIGLYVLPYRWAVGAALVATFEPLISAIHILIMPETLFVLFLMGFVYFFLSYTIVQNNQDIRKSDFRNVAEVGLPNIIPFIMSIVFLVLAVYTKPAALYLVIFPVLLLIFGRRQYIRASVFAGIFILALVPWMARNAIVGENFAVTNDDTGNICGWTLHGVLATKHGVDPTDWSTTWDLPEFEDAKKKCQSPFSALKLFITEYPVPFAKMVVLSTLSFVTNEGYSVFFEKPQEEQIKPHHNFLTPAVFAMSDWKEKLSAAVDEFSFTKLLIIFIGKLFWLTVCISAFVGACILIQNPRHRIQGLFVVFIIFYFISVTVFVTAYGAGSRLRYPISTLLIVLAVYAMECFYKRIWMRSG